MSSTPIPLNKVSNGVHKNKRLEGYFEDAATGLINKKLPKELLLRVFSFLDIVALCRCAQVSKAWNLLALDGSNWQQVNLFEFQRDVRTNVVQSLSRRCGGFLKTLNLKGCQGIEDDALRTFAQNCKNIEELVLCDCNKITNKTCIYLSNFANKLVVLDFESCTQVDDLGLAKIGSGCSKLEHLNIAWCRKVSSAGLIAIAHGCPSLELLVASGCVSIRDEGLRVLAVHCGGLKKIVLQGCTNITDNGIKPLGDNCNALEFVNISECEALTDQTLKYIADGCHELKTLEAARCSQFTDTGFSTLARGCHSMQRLDLEECTLITDHTLHCLSYNCSEIVNLTFSHCELITDEGIRHLAGGTCAIEKLEIIELDNCPLITDQALEYLMNCRSLNRLELYDCHNITRGGIRRLKSRLPNVRVQAYFAPVTPPPATPNRRQRSCRCCEIL
ncbi:F-box/LRR-repeat protein 2-like [Clytia hemisphaerica]|uniref:F-box/LRR-repeat protein 2 n=1 Tax=Clytia hemisphaerica TaxID=252671 RepID=A0A7M5XGE7_9CNID